MAKETPAAGTKKPNRIVDAIRKVFADAGDNLAEVLDAEDLTAGNGGSDDGHTHIHIHGSGGGMGAAAPTDDDTMPAAMGGEAADAGDPTEKRFQALEAGMQQMMASIGEISKMVGALVSSEEEEANVQGREGPIDGKEESTPLANGGEETPAAAATDDSDEGVLGMDDKKLAATPTADAALARCYKATIAAAEILVPGFKAPTVDSKGGRKGAVSTICAARRRALDAAYVTADGAAVIDAVRGTKNALDLDKMDCAAVSKLFHSAAGAKALMNNTRATAGSSKTADAAATKTNAAKPTGAKAAIKSISDLNAYYNDVYKEAGH